LRHYGVPAHIRYTPCTHTCGYNLGFLRAIGFPVEGGGRRGVVEKRGKFFWCCILVTNSNILHVPKQPEKMPVRYYKFVTYLYLCLCFQWSWAFEMGCRCIRNCVAFITIFRSIHFAKDELCLYCHICRCFVVRGCICWTLPARVHLRDTGVL